MPDHLFSGKNEGAFDTGARLVADSDRKWTRHFESEAIRPHAGHATL